MNRSELSNKIIQWAHRTDLAGQIDMFIDNTTNRINLRLGTAYELAGANAENVISRDYPEIYLYGGLRECMIYAMDEPATMGYEQLYQEHISRLNITAESEDFTDDSPYLRSECEQQIEDANDAT